MKIRIIFLFLISITSATYGQSTDEVIKGNISYISTQNIYVKFTNTDGIHIGDTLYLVQNEKPVPALVVTSFSTISCVGSPISTNALTVSTQIIAKVKIKNTPIDVIVDKSKESVAVNDLAMKATEKKVKDKDSKARFNGRLSATSYTNVSSRAPNQRFRYNLSMNAEHIGNSNLSAESYISFTHKLGDSIKINNALKIYSLALKYDLSKTSSISFGRKIYNNMANIGAVDGLEYEQTVKNITFGALVGSRPDFLDYSFNPKLIQFGGFVSHYIQKENGNMQTSIAIFNQMNNFKTDRRFVYLQHTNSLLKNVDLFSSFEFDLYGYVNSQLTNKFDLTSTYISLRFKPWKPLSLSLSYDARKNIYYFETFKTNKLDSLYDKETRQGLRFQTIYRPFKNVIWGGNAGYRFAEQTDLTHTASINGYTYLSYTQVPLINTYTTISATALTSRYMKRMMVYGISMSRDFLAGKVYTELEYKFGSYQDRYSTVPTQQATMSLFWRVAKKTTLSVNFDANFETNNGLNNNYGSVFINLSQRF